MLETAVPCCRLAWIKEMVLTILFRAPPLPPPLLFFLFRLFRFDTKKGEGSLPHPGEGSPPQPLQHGDGS
jgi:hypothetical protein